MKTVIRPGEPEDLKKIELWDFLDTRIYEWKIKNNEIFLAEVDMDVVGYLRLEYLWSKYPYIGLIKVNEDYRRQGIGRSILDFLEEHLRLNGHDTLFSSSQVNEVEPQKWHRRMGFYECGMINGINQGEIGEIFFKKHIKNNKVGDYMEVIKKLLSNKFEEIQRRIILVLDQLSDEQVNWRPNESSNSIANLIVHIRGNINERITKGIHNEEISRNRDEEFEEIYRTKQDLIMMTNESLDEIIETTKIMTEETFMKTQLVRNKERTNLDMLLQCSTHFSEHMGQVLYIGKMIKDREYITTSIPMKTRDKDLM